ncbi:MAG: IS66 family transposase, partial [bacterium]|nr:IS66 family transposase [bacterium]
MVCEGCLEKQRKIDKLEEENKLLKAKIRYRERSKQEGFFGSSTPSSKLPVKSNSLEENQNLRGGAKAGHSGHGRRSLEIDQADNIVDVSPEVGEFCPECNTHLMNVGIEQRSVLEISPIKPEKRLYLLQK